MNVRILPMTRTPEDVAVRVRRYRVLVRKAEGATELEVRLSTLDLTHTCNIEEIAALLEARPFAELRAMARVVAEADASFSVQSVGGELTLRGRPGHLGAAAPE